MIGVVIATHGHLAEEMLRTAETVVGRIEQARAVVVDCAVQDMRGALKDAIKSVDTGEGVLLLTDLLGGSPTNLCLSFIEERQVEVVTGVNLPMLLKLGPLRGSGRPILQVAADLVAAGQHAIGHASGRLRSLG